MPKGRGFPRATTMNLLAAVTFADGIGMDDLAWLAGLIAMVTTIVAAVWAMLRPLKRQADRIESFWEDWNGAPARPGRSAVPGVMDRLASIDGELQRNGGNSLKARVIGNSRKIAHLASQIDQIKSEARDWHAKRTKGTDDDS